MRGRMSRIPVCAVLCLVAWTPLAGAQLEIVVGPGQPITSLLNAVTQAIASPTTEIRITLEVDNDNAPYTFTESAGVIIDLAQPNKKLTIAGSRLSAPYEVIVTNDGLPTPVFTVMGAGTVVFESLTIDGGGSAGISVIGGTARVVVNRCLVQGSDGPGLSFSGGTSIVANSCFADSAGAAIDVSSGQVSVVQSTIINGNDDGIHVSGGRVQVIGCLLYENAGSALSTNSAGVIQASYCTSKNNGSDETSLIENPVDAIVQLAPASRWPGDLAAGIAAPDMDNAAAQEYRTFDFEYQARIGEPQVGADFEGGAVANLTWIDTQYTVFDPGPYGAGYGDGRIYVGKGAAFRIFIIGQIDFVDDFVLLEPQSGAFNVIGRHIQLPLTGEPGNPTEPGAARVGYADYALQSTRVDNLVLDGLVTVYLVANGEVLGINAVNTEDRVAPQALLNSRLLVLDTIAPEMDLPPENDADEFIIAGSDTLLAVTDTGSAMPQNWPPAQTPAPTNLVAVVVSGASAGNAGMYLNGPGPLAFSVSARFIDRPPDEAQGVEVSGFDAGLGALSAANVPAGDLLNASSDTARPYWVGSFLHARGIDPADLVTANFAVAGAGARVLDVDWSVLGPAAGGIPMDRATGNDWRIDMRFVAMDRAGNTSSLSGNAVELWWMPFPAQAKLTSTSPYNGTTASLPAFSWELNRQGASPSNSSPCDPVFTYRLWKAEAGLDAASATWTALGGWAPWDRVKSLAVDQNLIMENPGSRMLISVLGADEAGNMQLAGPLAGDAFTGFAVPEGAGIAFDHWVNPGDTGHIETVASAHFWHEFGDNATIDPGDRDFLAGPRIPLAPEGGHVEARIEVVVKSPVGANRFVHWELFEDGEKIAGENYVPALEPLVIYLRKDKKVTLGDEALRTRTRNYLVRTRGEFVLGAPPPIVDATPATISFTVYIPEGSVAEGVAGGAGGDAGDEQPFKVFVRGEE